MLDATTLVALAEAITPAGRLLPPPDPSLTGPVEDIVRGQFGDGGVRVYRGMLRALDLAGLPFGGRLTTLPPAERAAALERLAGAEATWALVRAVAAPIKAARVRTSGLIDALGARPDPPARGEHRRWHQQIVDATTLGEDLELEVDVVIVGSGAGGAPIARALAAEGHAVVILEEGAWFTRESFDGDGFGAQWRMFRDGGATLAYGNAFLPVPMGRTVGGSTTVNSGTCYRVPPSVQRRWVLEEGLAALAPGALDASYEKVEAMLRVAPATWETLGGCARVIARGAEALGLAHGPLVRNAPDCDGRGLCCFGCPTDAKRSTNVSYIPAALERGAQLFSRARVERILVDGDRATGVVARTSGGRLLTVRAGAVVLAAGAVGTPALLLRAGLANSSGRVGHGLTVHPATYAWGLFDEPIRGYAGIPQGYAIEELVEHGIRFEGVFVPPDMGATTMATVGHRWTELVEAYDRLACFGFMVTDTARGRVVVGPGGKARMLYSLHDTDRRRMIRAHALLARVYLAAGAREVLPAIQGAAPLRTDDDVRRFEREAPDRFAARHLDVSAFHPLGTCRMGADPGRSVVSPDGETHDVRHLFVCDGSAVPGPLGVNPQMTIMALSERAAARVAQRVEEAAAHSPRRGRRVAFAEVMTGTLTWAGSNEETPIELRVRAELPVPVRITDGGVTLDLAGTLDVPPLGVAHCTGTLQIHPLRRRRTLRYELVFEAGGAWRLLGDKHVSLLSAIRGMTTLHTRLLDSDGHAAATGTMRFDLHDVPTWLSSWKAAQA